MQYKKIILTPSSGIITKLESDTILSYVFAYNFEKLQNIFNKFINKKDLPFVITNAFLENQIPRPFYYKEEKKEQKSNFYDNLKKEKDKKNIKKLKEISLELNIIKNIFEGEQEKLNEKLKKEVNKNEKLENFYKEESVYKNVISRLDFETTPFEIDDVVYTNKNFVIYIKVFDENDFNDFFKSLKTTFENIGFGKKKSVGFGQFKEVKKENLSSEEEKFFKYLENLEKEKNLKLVLNNYKPSKNDLENVNEKNSFISLNFKHPKSLSEFNEFIFKGQMNFIGAGSVLKIKNNLVGDYYKSNNSYNFGFIF